MSTADVKRHVGWRMHSWAVPDTGEHMCHERPWHLMRQSWTLMGRLAGLSVRATCPVCPGDRRTSRKAAIQFSPGYSNTVLPTRKPSWLDTAEVRKTSTHLAGGSAGRTPVAAGSPCTALPRRPVCMVSHLAANRGRIPALLHHLSQNNFAGGLRE